MDADRPGEALTGSALDREIRAALAVDPSPEFVARVRTRIASEPARAASWISWKLVAVGAITALIAIAVVVSRTHDVSPVFPAHRVPLQARTVAPFSQLVFVASDFSRTKPRSAKAFPPPLARDLRELRRGAPKRLRREGGALQPREPEILFDPAETRALRRLIAGTREGTLDLSASLQATTPTVLELPPVSEIAIPFITIDPITPQGGEEGARQ